MPNTAKTFTETIAEIAADFGKLPADEQAMSYATAIGGISMFLQLLPDEILAKLTMVTVVGAMAAMSRQNDDPAEYRISYFLVQACKRELQVRAGDADALDDVDRELRDLLDSPTA